MLQQRIQQHFFDSADLLYAAAEALSRPIADATQALVGCLTAGGKALACGSGGSIGAAEQFAAGFVDRFERERPGLAALALSANASLLSGDGGDDAQCYARQVQALGAPGDVLLVAGAQGAAAPLLAAVHAAHAREMTVIVLGGHNPARWHEALTDTDVCIAVPHERAARVREVHLLVVHCLCDAVDLQLLGEEDSP
jgi:D-sedoheptulose 7-phosphate isomerase